MKMDQTAIIENMNSNMPEQAGDWLYEQNGKPFKFRLIMSEELKNTQIEDLDLSVRSFNCLKRAGVSNIEELTKILAEEDGLTRIRNLGQKSSSEIKHKLFYYHYSKLPSDRRKDYMKMIYEINKDADE
ncbi:MAG: hypothetical protein K6E33_00995 [Lachnospiraceae bacterium]|nr:hypothetical protein [Lachnospiraceae bacterium]